MFFGRHRKLMRDGARAQAVVTAARRSGGHTGAGGSSPVTYQLDLRVHLPDGSTADASCRVGGALGGTGLWFRPGDIVPVCYEPADLSTVVVDEPALQAQRDAEQQALNEAAVTRAERRLAGLPETDPDRPLPTDDQLQAAYRAWRAAAVRTKQSKAAHRRARSEDDTRETLRLFNQSATRTAEEKSARTKLDGLRRLRPDWTPAPEDTPRA